jgi:hypothetical protein
VEHLLEALVGVLLEVVGDALLEVLFGLVAEALSGVIKRREDASPVVLTLGLAGAGAGAGLLSGWLVPHRLIVGGVVIPGLSLVVAPLMTGVVMGLLGKQIRRAGHWPSSVATFRGGAVFAFAMALVRWWLVGSSR